VPAGCRRPSPGERRRSHRRVRGLGVQGSAVPGPAR
jgi:hypothetical protein